MQKYFKVSHIKELYVREVYYVVGVLFLLVSHSPWCVGPQPVAPVKPPVVAEWGSGVTPRLDSDTISKHVKQMVDVSTTPLPFTSAHSDASKAELTFSNVCFSAAPCSPS